MEVVFEREDLYREVWKTPITKLATKYGLSDNGLRKVCRALEIPVPQRGHWARLAAGHRVPTPPLPPTSGPTRFVSRPPSPPMPAGLATEDESWLEERLQEEKHPGARIVVPAQLVRPHRLVAQTSQVLRRHKADLEKARRAAEASAVRHPSAAWEPNYSAFMRPSWNDYVRLAVMTELPRDVLPLRVSLESAERALRLWDSLLKGCERRGMTAEIRDGKVQLSYHNETVLLRLSEQVQKEPIAKSHRTEIDNLLGRELKCVANGNLRFFVEEKMVSDELGKPLEEQLNLVVAKIYRSIFSSRARHLRWRQEALERKVAEEHREAEIKAIAEQRRILEEEKRREDDLFAEASAWSKADLIRAYASHIRAGAGDIQTANPALVRWIDWAMSVADKVDPTMRRIESQI